MTILGIDLNDAAITVVGGGRELAPAPGYALARDGGMLFGPRGLAAGSPAPPTVNESVLAANSLNSL